MKHKQTRVVVQRRGWTRRRERALLHPDKQVRCVRLVHEDSRVFPKRPQGSFPVSEAHRQKLIAPLDEAPRQPSDSVPQRTPPQGLKAVARAKHEENHVPDVEPLTA